MFAKTINNCKIYIVKVKITSKIANILKLRFAYLCIDDTKQVSL